MVWNASSREGRDGGTACAGCVTDAGVVPGESEEGARDDGQGDAEGRRVEHVIDVLFTADRAPPQIGVYATPNSVASGAKLVPSHAL